MENENVSFMAFFVTVFFYGLFHLLSFIVDLLSKVSRGEKRTVVVKDKFRDTDPDISHLQLVPIGYYQVSPQPDENWRYPRSAVTQNHSEDIFEEPYVPSQHLSRHLRPEYRYHGELPSLRGSTSTVAPSDSLPAHQEERQISSKPQNRNVSFLDACWDCNFAEIKSCIERGENPHQLTKAGETGLFLSVYQMAKGKRKWDPHCLQFLVDNGCHVDAETNDHNTALHMAVKNEHVPAIEWLLEHGANIQIANDAGWRPTTIAEAIDRDDITRLLWRSLLIEKKGGSSEAPQRKRVRRCLFPERD